MKLNTFFCFAMLLTTPAIAADRGAIEKALVASEEGVIAAIVKGDAAGFTKLLAPESVSTDAAGIVPSVEFAKVIPQMKVSEPALFTVAGGK